MKAIFLFIPTNTTLKELKRFARSGLGSWFNFGRNRKITKSEILDIYDEAKDTHGTHGVVTFATREDGQQAIEALDGKELNGKPVEVRKYHHRSPSDKRVHRVSGGSDIYRDSRRKELNIEKCSDADKPKKRKRRHLSSSQGGPIEPSSRLQEAMKRKDGYWPEE